MSHLGLLIKINADSIDSALAQVKAKIEDTVPKNYQIYDIFHVSRRPAGFKTWEDFEKHWQNEEKIQNRTEKIRLELAKLTSDIVLPKTKDEFIAVICTVLISDARTWWAEISHSLIECHNLYAAQADPTDITETLACRSSTFTDLEGSGKYRYYIEVNLHF